MWYATGWITADLFSHHYHVSSPVLVSPADGQATWRLRPSGGRGSTQARVGRRLVCCVRRNSSIIDREQPVYTWPFGAQDWVDSGRECVVLQKWACMASQKWTFVTRKAPIRVYLDLLVVEWRFCLCVCKHTRRRIATFTRDSLSIRSL